MKILILGFLLSFLSAAAQSNLDQQIATAAAGLQCSAPNEQTPVTLNAQLVTAGDSLAVIVKASIAQGWHIYALVSPGQPYMVSEPLITFPEGVKPVGDWKKTEPMATANAPGVLIYEDEVVFVHKAVKGKGAVGTIKAGLYFQSCDIRQCLPPKEVTFDLKYEQK